MELEHLGQYWNPVTRRVHLLGKCGGALVDLTPHLPYASIRSTVLEKMAGSAVLPLLLDKVPFPTAQAVLEAEQQKITVPQLLEPVFKHAVAAGEQLSESALDISPSPGKPHLMACILPLRAQAFGVTYENSALEREAEGHKEDYQYVYKSVRYRGERSEVFIKGTRLAHFYGQNGNMGLRSDLTNSMDSKGKGKARETVLSGIEPELAAVCYSDGRILGYTLANDVSGNQIENESILYLYQAKYFTAAMGIGPWLLLSDEQVNPGIIFTVEILDEQGSSLFKGEANSSLIGMPLKDLVAQAASHNALYPGELFSTGTNIVPGDRVKVLQPGWKVIISARELGAFVQGAAMVSASETGNLNYHSLEMGG